MATIIKLSREWMSLSENELVWVRVRVEGECVSVNLTEENKVSEFHRCRSWIQDGRIQHGRIQDGCHQWSWVWMNEWSFFVQMVGREVWVNFFCSNGGNQSWQVWVSLRGKTKMADSKMAKFKMAEFKMAAKIKLSENEWVWVRLN